MATTTPHYVSAEFESPGAAREAAVRAETLGFDADAIELLDPPAPSSRPDERRAGDVRPIARVGSRAGLGAALGSAVGALIGVVAGLISGDVTAGLVVGVAGVAGGGAIGGLAGTYARLPVDQTAFVADELEPRRHPGTVTVRIRVADETEATRARTALDGR